jgi:hypothetical protein
MEGYWTDASSNDALSDVETEVIEETITSSTTTIINKTPLTASTTPINPSSSQFYSSPPSKAYYIVTTTQNASTSEQVEIQVIQTALKTLGILEVIIISQQEQESLSNTNNIDASSSILIFQDFVGPLFETLRRKGSNSRLRIYGVPIILELASAVSTIPINFPISKHGYPIYSRMLKNCKICATGIKTREELVRD